MRLVHSVTPLALCFLALCSGAAPKKFIELGWDIPNTSFLREHHREMENTPFDGVIFKVEIKDDQGRAVGSEAIWDRTPWKQEWLQEPLADLKACKFSRFTDNFVRFNATPGNLDWADDAGWTVLAGKARLCAWLMRAGAMKGIALDFESYGANQFRYDPAKGATFEETALLARKRGAQWMQAVAKEFPDAVILCLWMNSINFPAGASDNPGAILATGHYGLLPAFIDGMLDELAPDMILVDGCENGNYMDSAEEYLKAANGMRSWHGPAIRLVSPGNRPKYRQQVQAGFGFYLDMFLNPEGHQYYRPPLDGSHLARLKRNLALPAMPPTNTSGSMALPLVGQAFEPAQDCRQRPPLGRSPALVHLCHSFCRGPRLRRARRNCCPPSIQHANQPRAEPKAFRSRPREAKPPSRGFSSWQHEKEKPGTFRWDPSIGDGSGRAANVKWGCLIQGHPATPGQTYAVAADCRVQGNSHPTLVVRWQTPQQRWTHEGDDRTFAFNKTAGQWDKAFGVITVPDGVGHLVILLNVTGQTTENDVCWFDNLELHRIK